MGGVHVEDVSEKETSFKLVGSLKREDGERRYTLEQNRERRVSGIRVPAREGQLLPEMSWSLPSFTRMAHAVPDSPLFQILLSGQHRWHAQFSLTLLSHPKFNFTLKSLT